MRNALLLYLLFFGIRVAAQPSVVLGVAPNTASPGQTLSIEVKGVGFPQNLSTSDVTFGADIAVSNVHRLSDQVVIINDAEISVNVIRVQITISSSASSGTRLVRVGAASSLTAAVFNVVNSSEPPPAGGRLSFTRSGNYKALSGPQEAASHDFTGDGILDLVLGAPGSNNLLLFTGQPSGRFSAPKRIHNETGAVWALEIADVNSDGRADLITGDENAPNVDVWINTDGLNFRRPQHTPIDASPWGLAIGDFNGDQRVDVIAAARDIDRAYMLLGRGDGSFQAYKLPAGFTPLGTAVCDFNNDDVDDAVVANFANGISLYQGSRSVGLIARGRKSSPVALENVACADFNNDGFADIAAIGGDSVILYRNLKNGAFASQKRIRIAPFVWNLTASDFNKDGNMDLAIVNQASGYLSIMAGLGNLTFSNPITYEAGIQPETLHAADFNKDSRIDIAVPNSAGNDLTVFLNTTTP